MPLNPRAMRAGSINLNGGSDKHVGANLYFFNIEYEKILCANFRYFYLN
jgi:hypothetical protein